MKEIMDVNQTINRCKATKRTFEKMLGFPIRKLDSARFSIWSFQENEIFYCGQIKTSKMVAKITAQYSESSIVINALFESGLSKKESYKWDHKLSIENHLAFWRLVDDDVDRVFFLEPL